VKILLIDDNDLLLRAATRYLQRAGHDVLSAPNGIEGLKLALDSTPERIICDFDMPGLDGCQVYDRLPPSLQEWFYMWTASIIPSSFPHPDRIIEKPCNIFEMIERARIV
jgi:sigma-B regulation protein RsbU (phosphoserine phosphatase)